MSTLIESYNSIAQKVSVIRGRIAETEREIRSLKSDAGTHIQARIKRLEEQLTKIDEYQLKVKAFQQLAERNLESRNIQTIEAPPGYRVNLNRLRQWAMMIDPSSSNDPYAQRVFVVSKCDELFLEKKRIEFTERIKALKNDESIEKANEIAQLETELNGYKAELQAFFFSEEMSAFVHQTVEENDAFWYRTAPQTFRNALVTPDEIAPGAYAVPLDAPDDQRSMMKNQLGVFYDADGRRVLLPLALRTDTEFVMEVVCSPSRTRQLDRAIRNLILSVVERYPAGENRVVVFDAVRFNTSSLGSLKTLEESFAMAHIPRNPEQLSSALVELLSSFADMDERLELYDSVIEYNRDQKEARDRMPRTTLIVYGWPNAFEGEDREHMQRIIMNYERYGISMLFVSFRNNWKKEDDESILSGYAAQASYKIRMTPKDTFIQIGENAPQRFAWYTLNEEVSENYGKSLRSVKVGRQIIGNEYMRRYSLTQRPPYTRDYKKVELPFGIDGKDEAHSLSFENENFATYLVGASRSGKSTLLHTLIAGLIRNYHPDNVELWLADFKQLEFKNYIEYCPPHVKYVLLDESTELVYDLLDKLTDKMMERQRIFAHLRKERIDQIDPSTLDEPLPLIFVILDEFSIMSQSIAESQIYRLKLQNLLAKGAALGIRFLFSSQTFTTGIAGLTPTARAQIQQRISMKGAKEEISETLELSANLKTEQVLNWMDALPPHYALVKFRVDADTPPQVKRFLVMYFPSYEPRNQMIQDINVQMHLSESYEPTNIDSYVDKHPVFVDGNSYDAFPQESASQMVLKNRETGGHASGNTVLLLGTPRLMEKIKPVTLTQETRENMLLICRGAEQTCGASILSSVMKCALLQGRRVSVWAYDKNPLYRFCISSAWRRAEFDVVEYSEGIDRVCDSIAALKQSLQSKKIEDELIVLLGMDRIFSDFEFFDGQSSSAGLDTRSIKDAVQVQEQALKARGALATEGEELRRAQAAARWATRRAELVEQLKKEGKSREEIKKLTAAAMKEFLDAEAPALPDAVLAAPTASIPDTHADEAAKAAGGAYNAAEDFRYVVMQGSRMGRHFLLMLGDYSDLKTAGVKLDWFRHRLSFQVSSDDSYELFRSRIASALPPHICQYSDSLNSFSFRPYLHPGIGWDDWTADDNGSIIGPY